MHSHRICLPLVFWLGSAIAIFGQSPTSAPQTSSTSDADKPPSIKVHSGLVLVPTSVTRPSGGRVSDLTRNNFTLLKNGQPQQIDFFEHVRTTAELMTRPETPSNTFTNTVQANSQRLTIFVLDQLNSSLLEQRTARDQLFKFLSSSADNKEPLCLLALDATGLKAIHDFTTDPAILAQALKQISQHGATKDTPQDNPLATTFRMVQGWHSPSAARNAASAEGRLALLQSTIESREMSDSLRIRLTLEALRAIGESFTGIPGRKSLIWSTGGFPFEIDDRAIFGTREQDLLASYDNTWRALNRANIAVYPLDVESLQNTAFVSPTVGLPLPQHYDFRSAANNLEKFAAVTGGKLCDRSMDAQSCFNEAAKDSSDYYLLGFYENPNAAVRPGWQKLAVKINLPKLEVRSRAGYYIGSPREDAQAKQKELQLALTSPLDYTGVPLTVTWTSTIKHEDQGKRQIGFKIAIPAEGISIDEPPSGPPHVSLEFSARAVSIAANSTGIPADAFDQSLDANPTSEIVARIKKQGIAAPGTLNLPPGDYLVTFAVRDNLTTQIGTVTAPLQVQ
jgi:VWFA-related protein